MAGYRFSGVMGNALSSFIDTGTLARGFSSPPGIVDPVEHARKWVRQQIRRGTSQGIEIAGRLTYDVALQELRDLRGDIETKLDTLSRLPKEISDQAAYDIFSAFFDHYLPKKFLRHYIWGKGKPIKLTLQEMKDCNPVINLLQSGPFTRRLEKLRTDASTAGKSVVYPFTLEMVAGAATNGTLGQFTVHFSGTITVTPVGKWSADGAMEFTDTWDFDPKDPEKGGRSAQGEAKTRFGNQFLPGTPFGISSETTAFRQTQDDDLVVWAGGRPKAELDRLSKSDVLISKPDR